MKTILKLLIAAAIINACARAGLAASRYYQLKDAAEQLITFGATETTTALHNAILEKSGELALPVQPENIEVHRQGTRTWADVKYTEPVEFFPSYKYPVDFSFSVNAFSLTAGRPEDPPAQ